MTNINDWIHTGETETGLQIWIEIDSDVNGTRYLKLQYKDPSGNKVGDMQLYPVSQVRLLNSLIDTWDAEVGCWQEAN